MFLLNGDAKYIDLLERTIYNGFLSGVGLDGKSFFYTNPMETNIRDGKPTHECKRSAWFECSCCPTNITRFLPSIQGYAYAYRNQDVYVNLFMGRFARNEAFPSNWYTFAAPSLSQTTIKINGQAATYSLDNGYAVLSRAWKKGDVNEVNLPMELRRVVAHENVKSDVGKVALLRGPLVYCAEFPDNNNRTSNLIIPDNATFTTAFEKDMLGGIVVVKSTAFAVNVDATGTNIQTKEQPFTAIPFYARCNRGEGEMRVWFPKKVVNVDLLGFWYNPSDIGNTDLTDETDLTLIFFFRIHKKQCSISSISVPDVAQRLIFNF